MNLKFQNYFLDIISSYYYEFSFIDISLWTVLPELFMLTSCFVLLLTSHLLKIKVIYRLSCTIFFLTLLYYSHLLVVCQFPAGLQDFFFKGFLFTDYYYFFFKGITVGLTLVLLLLCQNILQNTQNNILKEFLLLILIATFFMLMLLSSNDFFFSYLSLEGLSFSLYILAASLYYNRLSIESALKYFILGGISSSILLYAISLILITTSSLDFFSIKYFFLEESNTGTTLDTIFIMACLCISFLFKLSAFPCHIWAPDVYEGVWTPITAFLSIVVKLVLFIFTIRVFCYVFTSVPVWQSFFLISGTGSIIIGCLGALLQNKIKRFLAYTSINQVGYLLLSVSTNTLNGLTSALMFLAVYVITNLIFFGLILNIKHFTLKSHLQIVFLTDLYSISSNNKSLNANNIWIITLFSMAGVPPLAGWFTKYYILLSLINLSLYGISFIILIFSTLSTYYYLNFIKYIMFERKPLRGLYFIDVRSSQDIGLILFCLYAFLICFTFLGCFFHDKIAVLSFCCKYIVQ